MLVVFEGQIEGEGYFSPRCDVARSCDETDEERGSGPRGYDVTCVYLMDVGDRLTAPFRVQVSSCMRKE